MSLGKLLAAGKSFANGRDAAAYRKNRHVYLPKFGSPKNPFVTSDKEPSQNAAPDTKPNASVAAAPQKFPGLSARPARVTSWTEKLNPFRNSPPAQIAGKSAVQVELLSLDAVKVVHNDLSDADVEVVPIKSRPATSEVPVTPTAEKPWGFLGERIMKAS
jgi:hypothetical protein